MAKKTGQEVPVESTEQVAPQKERMLVDKLVARGLELDVEDDDSLLESMEQLLSDRESGPDRNEYERLKKLEPFATEYTQHAADFQRWKAEQAERAKAPKDDEELKPPSPPKIDAAASQVVQAGLRTGAVVRDDATGLYQAKDPNFTSFVSTVNAGQLQRREFFQRFEDDPGSFVAQYAEPHIKALKKQYEDDLKSVKEEMGKLRKKHSEESIEKFFERNYQEYWVTDEEGTLVRDEKTGQGSLNARGKMYVQIMNDLKEDIPDEDKRHLRAVALAKQVPLEDIEQQPADRKKRFLKRASEKPGRTTTRAVEHTSATKADAVVTAGKKNGRMDWDELMRVTAASMQ